MASSLQIDTPTLASTTAAPVAGPAVAGPSIKRSRWWVDLLVVAWLAWLYDVVTGMAPLREALAFGHARTLLHFERSLDLAPELALNHWLAGHHTLGLVLSYYYDNAHFIVTFGLLAWLWWRRADVYRPLRNSLVAVNLIGLVVFWRYPVAPPRMLGGFTDVIASSGALGSWHTGKLAADADQLAAMPSLHIAWAVWCGLALWRISCTWNVFARRRLLARRWVRMLAVLYPCVTTIVVLSTGNHYLIDVIAGLATTAVAFVLVRLASVTAVTKLLRSRRTGRLTAAAEDAL